MSGVHEHNDSNPQGIHSHPELMTGPGGRHDHSIDAFGSHLHFGEYEGQYILHVAGAHGHGLDAEENERNSRHEHMSPDVKILKADIEITAIQKDRFTIVRKGQHTVLGDDFDQAVDMVKAESRSSYDVQDDWGLRYCHQDLEGFYLIDKAVYGDDETTEGRKKKRREIAKLFVKTFGWAELCRVRGRSGNNLVVERTEGFQIEAVEKTVTAPPSTPDTPQPKENEPVTKRDVLHSISLSKSVFSTLGDAQGWLRKNGIGYQRHLETNSEFTFYRGDIGLDDPHTREIGGGITAFFGKADGFQVDVDFVKFDDEKKIVYGIVYEPEVVDSQGDWATSEDIEKAAHEFMRTAKTDCVDTQHDFEKNGCHVVESFIARSGDPDFREGTWVVATKVADELWGMVKSGEINGYSMAGKGVRMFDQEHPPMQKSFEKTADMDEDDDKKKPKRMKKGHRLTNIQVDFISLVHRGANGRDFAFRKSDACKSGVIFKSADHKIQENSFTPQQDDEGFILRVVKAVMNALGRGQHEGTGPNLVPDRRVELSMDAKIDPGTASVLNLLKNLAGRAAVSERIVHAFAKSQVLEDVLKNDPQLKETVSKLDPSDLEAFEKELGMFLQQGANNNGVTLPPLRNFFGFAMDPSVSPGRFMQGSMPGGGVAFGEPTVDRMPVSKGLDDLQKAVAAMQAEMSKLAGPAGHEDQKQALEQQIAAALSPMAKSMEQLTSTVAALKKSATEETPADPPAAANGGQTLSTGTPTPPATDAAPAAQIKKSDHCTPENPFGDPADIFGGIRLNRGA